MGLGRVRDEGGGDGRRAATGGESKGRLEPEVVGCRGEGRESKADDGPSLLSVQLLFSC